MAKHMSTPTRVFIIECMYSTLDCVYYSNITNPRQLLARRDPKLKNLQSQTLLIYIYMYHVFTCGGISTERYVNVFCKYLQDVK